MITDVDHARTVLVVDDDADIRDAFTSVLDAEGYVTLQAENGAVALDLLHAGLLPCLILLDLSMPVMDGEQFCRERDLDPELAAIPVVIVSAIADCNGRGACARATARLRKPVDLDTLLETVARTCRAPVLRAS